MKIEVTKEFTLTLNEEEARMLRMIAALDTSPVNNMEVKRQNFAEDLSRELARKLTA